jgi:hypothetical protein
MNTMTKRILGSAFAGALVLGGAACGDDEDGDGGNTDEELQDVEDTAEDLEQDVEDGAEDVGNEVEQELDAQDEGSNDDGE